MKQLTTISLEIETKQKLDSLKIIPRESYECLIKRLIAQFCNKGEDNV